MTPILRNIPNILTALRLAAAPAMAILLIANDYGVAFGVFAFAGVSDLVDGFLARRYGLATRFGRYLDPAADKALMLACFLVLAAQGLLPVWLAVLVIGRDVLMLLGVASARAAAAPLGVVPLPIGKLSTVLQVGFIGVLLLALTFDFDLGEAKSWAGIAIAAVTVASGASYGVLWLRAMRAVRKDAPGRTGA